MKPEKAYTFDTAIKSSWADTRPNFSEFEDVYDEMKLKRDAMRLKEKRARIFAQGAFDKSEDIELSEDFEYCLMEALHNRGWFDESVTVSAGSQYDDLFHGIDLILSFRIDNADAKPTYEYLAIDATVAQNPDVLERKEKEIQNNLMTGQMAIAEYFINDNDPAIKGTIRMPRIIFGSLPTEAIEFKNLLSKGKNPSSDDQNKLERYKQEIFQRIEEQLETWIEFLTKISQTSTSPALKDRQEKIAAKYKKVLELFRKNKKG
ncbi:hypothetical protein HY932_01470 [Candidatus Falkowbacteria bacterium]|nr:hypothetical protein [Candidatus Falkowbacteria bacterium]